MDNRGSGSRGGALCTVGPGVGVWDGAQAYPGPGMGGMALALPMAGAGYQLTVVVKFWKYTFLVRPAGPGGCSLEKIFTPGYGSQRLGPGSQRVDLAYKYVLCDISTVLELFLVCFMVQIRGFLCRITEKVQKIRGVGGFYGQIRVFLRLASSQETKTAASLARSGRLVTRPYF